MTSALRMTNLYAPTLKEDPNDAEVTSHRLLLRSGMIRKSSTGMYSFLPLGFRVLQKVTKIVREEMDAIGAQEIVMPILQSADIWEESGRWNKYGPELMRLVDRHEHEYCLGPTHEELVVDLVRNELRSYKQLPTTLYQIQSKFRDEIRPRFGLLRSREFIMKDAYSFNPDFESLQETYDEMGRAYTTIFNRLDLDNRPVEADSGQIGGNYSTEYMALAEEGEAELVHCSCGFAADVEAAACIPHPTLYDVAMEKIETPGVHTIEDLSKFLDIPESSTVKAFSGKVDDEGIVVLFVPGDHEVNEIKAAHTLGSFTPLTDEEMEAAGLHKGSMGPVHLPRGVRVVADESLQAIPKWVVGANEDGYHFVGAEVGVDFEVDIWADLCVAKPGDDCPVCGKPLVGAYGIEVGQIFQLGTKYSESMGATFMDEDGSEKPYVMGCYGIGVTRSMSAIIEQHNDENGISWPLCACPAHICVIPLSVGDDLVEPAAEKLAEELADLGLEVVIDDRKERPGVKFADNDLIGWPLQIIVGKRGLANGNVEVKLRRTGERADVPINEVVDRIKQGDRRAFEGGSGIEFFDALFGRA
ncbi:MAG: proline--tRNA ligase [Eggerthellaceae bacterium]|jgi:prolyl-tRNA synthetase